MRSTASKFNNKIMNLCYTNYSKNHQSKHPHKNMTSTFLNLNDLIKYEIKSHCKCYYFSNINKALVNRML